MSGDRAHFEHMSTIPHSAALGMEFLSMVDGVCEVKISYADHLVGDPDTGVIHGGAITALMDNASGFAARPVGETGDTIGIATLDMRIDYMGPAVPGRDVIARARCVKRTRNVAFVRTEAYQDDPDDPIAMCTATFMIGTRNTARDGAQS